MRTVCLPRCPLHRFTIQSLLFKCNIMTHVVRFMQNDLTLSLLIFPQSLKDNHVCYMARKKKMWLIKTQHSPRSKQAYYTRTSVGLQASAESWRTEVTAGPDQTLIPHSLPEIPPKTIPFQQWASQVLLCPHHQTAARRSKAVLRCPLDIKHHEAKCGNEGDYEDVWNAVATCNVSS